MIFYVIHIHFFLFIKIDKDLGEKLIFGGKNDLDPEKTMIT